MTLAALWNYDTAYLFVGGADMAKQNLMTLQIVDYDQFVENFNLWSDDPIPNVNLFFNSTIIKGIKQHLANTQDQSVGVCGEALKNIDCLSNLIKEYNARGYGVVVFKDGNISDYIPCSDKSKVKIRLK